MLATKVGERGRNRTFNLLIKSQLLCQLSYAPTVGILAGRWNSDYSIRVGWQRTVSNASSGLFEVSSADSKKFKRGFCPVRLEKTETRVVMPFD